MIECPRCGRLYPEVVGAPEQVCPHCGHEVGSAPEEAPRALPAGDPVGALALAARLARRHPARLLLAFLPALVVEMGAVLLLDAYVRAAGIPAAGPETTGQQMQYLGVGVPLYLLVFTVRLACWAFVSAIALDAALGGARASRWRALALPALVGGLVLTLTYAAGWLMLIVGFLVFFHWFLYAPAMLADGAPGVGAAFERSRRFARERRTAGFTALALVVGAVMLVPYFLLAGLPGLAGLLAPPAWAWLAGPLVPLLAASYVAVARQAGPAGAERASSARATTTCPKCLALVPYTPIGSPVDVTCPSCGTTGRVL